MKEENKIKEVLVNIISVIGNLAVIGFVILLLVSPSTILRYVGLDNHKSKSKTDNEQVVYICNKAKSKTGDEINMCHKANLKEYHKKQNSNMLDTMFGTVLGMQYIMNNSNDVKP